MELSKSAKYGVIVATSALAVCYTRHILQYGIPPWSGGVWAFLGSWLVHYFAIAFSSFPVYVISSAIRRYLFARPSIEESDIFETVINVSVTLFVISLLILLLRYLSPIGEINDYYEWY